VNENGEIKIIIKPKINKQERGNLKNCGEIWKKKLKEK
jgi:hypothetical protein